VGGREGEKKTKQKFVSEGNVHACKVVFSLIILQIYSYNDEKYIRNTMKDTDRLYNNSMHHFYKGKKKKKKKKKKKCTQFFHIV
jgi:hypothetical protein